MRSTIDEVTLLIPETSQSESRNGRRPASSFWAGPVWDDSWSPTTLGSTCRVLWNTVQLVLLLVVFVSLPDQKDCSSEIIPFTLWITLMLLHSALDGLVCFWHLNLPVRGHSLVHQAPPLLSRSRHLLMTLQIIWTITISLWLIFFRPSICVRIPPNLFEFLYVTDVLFYLSM